MKKTLLGLTILALIFVFGGISPVFGQESGQSQGQGQEQMQGPGQGQGQGQGQQGQMPGQGQGQGQGKGQGLGQGLEKILSPDQIKNFKAIIKNGNALFGVRKTEPTSDQPGQSDQSGQVGPTNQSNQSDTASGKNSILEKISGPSEIPLFEKIIKKGTALWGMRKNNVPKPVYVTPAAAQCVKDAIDKKDTALKASTSNHDQKALAAIDVRGTCQKAALDQTTAQSQFDANKVCVDTFLSTIKDVNTVMAKEKSEAKKTYMADLKSCSALQSSTVATSTAQTLTSDIMIEDGGDTVEMSKQ